MGPHSRYLTMRDGIRLAVDLWLPPGWSTGDRVPTILLQTRYFRRIRWRAPARWMGLSQAADINHRTRTTMLRAGYAWLDVDARGSGASFGSRPCPWYQDEVRDGAEVVDWIVAQPWSNGLVGATGISYSGTAAEFLLSNRHPAVRAVMPRFSLFDVYPDVAFPGGLPLRWFTQQWSQANRALDANAFDDAASRISRSNAAGARQWMSDRGWKNAAAWMALLETEAFRQLTRAGYRRLAEGVAPSGDDTQGHGLRAALAEHAENFDVDAGARAVTFRDDAGISDLEADADIDTFSPHRYYDDIRAADAHVFSQSGWYDGAYCHAAIKRFLHLPAQRRRLLLGPWEHGGAQHISPHHAGWRNRFDHHGEILRFFDLHLRGRDDGLGDEPPVRYYTLGAEKWRTADTWPPAGVEPTPWFLGPNQALLPAPPIAAHRTPYRVDPTLGTGRRSRWRCLLGLAVPVGYGDQRDVDRHRLCFTSAPLTADLEVTGHPVVHLTLTADAPDAAVFAYLEEVAPNGRVTYVTEGQLRALHRRVQSPPPGTVSAVPWRSFTRADARPLTPGTPATLVFDLLPVSYRFRRGYALRLALAGADRHHFGALEHAATQWQLHQGGATPSRLELPVMRA